MKKSTKTARQILSELDGQKVAFIRVLDNYFFRILGKLKYKENKNITEVKNGYNHVCFLPDAVVSVFSQELNGIINYKFYLDDSNFFEIVVGKTFKAKDL